MNRPASASLLLAALLAAGAGGYWAGRQDFLLFASSMSKESALRHPARSPIIAIRTGRSMRRSRSRMRRARPISRCSKARMSASIPLRRRRQMRQAAGQPGKIRFYRNPMGLPDTSPVPKKDSMGMDYIPVYEGDEDESGIVRLSPGKVQRTGVRSELAMPRRIAAALRAPGIVALDERRVIGALCAGRYLRREGRGCDDRRDRGARPTARHPVLDRDRGSGGAVHHRTHAAMAA